MSELASAFRNGKAFIPFVTCGDPDLDTTAALVRAMAESGADLIELGIPFSDPTAEGPVIQCANERALSGGVTTDMIFDMVGNIRQEIDIPMVFMTYANVVFSYGLERFAENAAGCGINGMILPDVPVEEKNEFAPVLNEQGLELVSMIAPTSSDRVLEIAEQAEGFLYCVSSLGVTGMREAISTDVGDLIRLVRRVNQNIPCAVGFGISTPQQAADMAKISDGVIVGSAIVNLVAQYGCDSVAPVSQFVREMKAAVAGE